MSQPPTLPAREGPSSISCWARASRAERITAGQEAYQPPIRSSRPFHRAGKPSITSGSRRDHSWSSKSSRSSSAVRLPPRASSSAVVITAAAKVRRTRSRRRSRCTRGSTMALRARASRKGSSGASSHRKNTTAPASHRRTVIVRCKKTLSWDI